MSTQSHDHDERALIANILDDRADRERYRVYGDWLEAQGDPRGPLVAIQLRADENPSDGALLVKQKAHFIRYPQLTPPLDTWRAHYRWKWGFIDEAHLEQPTPDELRTLLDHRACAVLRTLRLDLEGDVSVVLEAVAQVEPTLEVLTLNALDEPDAVVSSELWQRVPRLDALTVHATGLFTDLTLPRLRSLSLDGVAFSPAGRWEVPALTTLRWNDPGPVDSLMPLVRAWPPGLRSLALDGCSSGYDIEEWLHAISTLTSLAISWSAFGSPLEACETLMRHAPRFRHLEQLVIHDLDPGDIPEALMPGVSALRMEVVRVRQALPQLRTERE